MLQEEGLDNVFARHHRLAEGIRRAVDAWGLKLCAQSPDLYSETVSAIVVPEGFDSTKLVVHAADKYGVAFGVGLGEVAGKVFRIGHLGSLDRRHGALRHRHRRDGHGRPRPADHAWQRRRRGAGILPRHRRRRAAEGRLTMTVDTAEDLYHPDLGRRARRARARPALHPPHADPDLALHQRARRRRALLQVREPAEGRRLQGARRLQRGLRPLRGEGEEGRRHALLGQPRPLALLRRRPPRHPLPRGDAAHRPAGEEGRGARLRRRHHRMRAFDVLARGGLRPRPGRDRRRLRPPLQRRAGDRRPGDLLQGDDRGPRRSSTPWSPRSAAAA